jgi:hypothetical protein
MRAEFRLKSPKAIGNANHLQIEKSIGLRNGDRAGLSALRTPKILNPIVIVVAFRHLPNMRPESGVFQSGALPHSNPLPIFGADPANQPSQQSPALGKQSRAILMTHERGVHCGKAKSLDRIPPGRFPAEATPELDWFQLPWKQIF